MRIAPAIAAAALTVAALALPAAASPQATKADSECGYHDDIANSWYTHCTSDGSNVRINVDYVLGPDKSRCVGPGKTWLGMRKDVQGAQYTGQLCAQPD